ncbi:Ig-like domain-containing protein [Hungatella hathewayi]|uniref:Ig-like domain-containing protein n=1 Tax=Hungatella hathewayi TaxID=154046 RepID=UPI003565AFFC
MAVKTVQAVINGVTTTLTYNSTSKKYEATITAPATSSYNNNDGHYFPVTIRATDEAGNTTTKNDTDATLGTSLKLQVKEKVAPIITITYPTASALITNNKPTITWKVTDDDSGVNPDTIGITIDSGSKVTGSAITRTAITGGYQCSYTPATALTDGSHTIKIDASDNNDNAATQKTVTFKVDTVPPTLSVTAPVAGLITNKAACTVTGTTNDITSSPVTVTIKLNSGSAEAVTVGADGSFSKSLTLASGNNTITIVATDSAGKSSTVTRTVTLDTTAPTIKSVTLTPNPVDAGKTYVISVEVTD